MLKVLFAALFLTYTASALDCWRCSGLECISRQQWQRVQCSDARDEECFVLNNRRNSSTFAMGCTVHSCRHLVSENGGESIDCEKCDNTDHCNQRYTIGVRQSDVSNIDNVLNTERSNDGVGGGSSMGGGVGGAASGGRGNFGDRDGGVGGGSSMHGGMAGGGTSSFGGHDFGNEFDGEFSEVTQLNNPFANPPRETFSCYKCRGHQQCSRRSNWQRESCPTTPSGGLVKPVCYSLHEVRNGSLYEMGCTVYTCTLLRAYHDTSACRKCAGDFCNLRLAQEGPRSRPQIRRRRHGHDHEQHNHQDDVSNAELEQQRVRRHEHANHEHTTHEHADHEHGDHESDTETVRRRRHQSEHSDHHHGADNMSSEESLDRVKRHETGEPHVHEEEEEESAPSRARRHQTHNHEHADGSDCGCDNPHHVHTEDHPAHSHEQLEQDLDDTYVFLF